MSNTPMGFPMGQMGPPMGQQPFGQVAEPAGKKSKKPKKEKQPKAAKPATESSRRVRGLFAILAAILAFAFVSSSLNANQSKGRVFVLRAASNILPLTPIAAEQLEAVEVAADAVEPGALRGDTAEAVLAAAKGGETTVVGRYALFPILAQQQIRLQSMLSADAQLGVALGADERLFTISVPLARAAAGLVRTGDRVDIYARGSESSATSRLLAEGVEVVLAAPTEDALRSYADSNPDADPFTRLPDYPLPSMYVVRVPVALLPAIIDADASGSLYLAYRGSAVTPTDPEAGSPTTTPNAVVPPTTTAAPTSSMP